MLPPALKALLAQFVGCAAALAFARGGLLPPTLEALAAGQALAAASVAVALKSARWWLPIHLAFVPLLAVAGRLPIAPGWYLVAFGALVAIFWSSFRTQVPLYPSSREVAEALASLLPGDRALRVLDVGSGTGGLLRRLAVVRPDCCFEGVEVAPAPWLVGRALARRLPNVRLRRGDFFGRSWAGQDVVYAFLSPVPMRDVWAKARRELRVGAVLVSNSFPVPGAAPDRTVEVGDARSSVLYLYRVGAAVAAAK